MINKADAGEEGATARGRHQMEEELRGGICGRRAGGRAELRCDKKKRQGDGGKETDSR